VLVFILVIPLSLVNIHGLALKSFGPEVFIIKDYEIFSQILLVNVQNYYIMIDKIDNFSQKLGMPMLIEFEVGNYLSFKGPQRLSLVSATPFKEFETENVFQAKDLRMLKSAVIYGANASGKSNLISAMSFMKLFVLNSAKATQSVESINVSPFKLDTATENAPSRFQIIFMLNDLRYRYGFEVDCKSVTTEWLYCSEAKKEYPLFLRKGDGIEVTEHFEEGKGLEARTRDNSLFLSTVDQFNGPTAKKILEWFTQFMIVAGTSDTRYERVTVEMLNDKEMRPKVLELIRWADNTIKEFAIKEEDFAPSELDPFTEEFKKKLISNAGPLKRLRISAFHPKYSNGSPAGSAVLDFNNEESEGTKKFFRVVGLMLLCLQGGRIIAVDELDCKLHPLLTRVIIRLFNSSNVNTKNAQLIFTTHDTNLLSYGQIRRDQIWFTERDEQGATALYSLAEIKLPEGNKVRKDASFEKDYIHGRYGAIPYFGDYARLFQKERENGQTH